MNAVILWLTKLQIRGINGRYVRTQSVMAPSGKQQEILVFSGENTLYSGQCTPLRTIIIHESALSDEQLFNYMITHEMGHKRQWWAALFVPLAIIALLGAITFLSAALESIIQTIATGNLGYLIFFPLGLLLAALLIAIPCAFSWSMELNADFQSIKTIGLQTYLDVINKPGKRKRSIGQKIIIGATHPPKEVTVRAWHRFHRS